MNRQSRTQLVLGVLLVLLGAWFLADRSLPAFHVLVAPYIKFPLSLVSIGAGILFLGLIFGSPSMAVPAAVIAGIGGLLYYFQEIGSYSDWYMWFLIPAFVGLGSIIAGLLGERTRHNLSRGLNLIVISAVLFLVFSSFAGGWAKLGNYAPAILIIALGLWLLGKGLFRTWRSGRSPAGPVETRENLEDKHE